MSTGPSSNSAEAPSEPEPPFTGGRRHSWLTSLGRHPVTWAIAGVILLGSVGVALLQQPGGSARAQSVYCGLVKCAVLRSVADSSTAAVGAPRPAAALPSSEAPSIAPASTPPATPASTPEPSQPKPVAVSKSPAPAPSPKPTPAPTPKPPAAPTPKPPPPWAPGPSRWPWPPTWGWPWAGGGGWHHFPPRR
jgi:hypothetical protein